MIHSRSETFISATNSNLRTCQQLIKEALLTLGCKPVKQINLQPEAGAVREMSHKRNTACHDVIHMAGEV